MTHCNINEKGFTVTVITHLMPTIPQAMSPDGQTIVTGAGDETLRFWNVFSKARSHKVLAL